MKRTTLSLAAVAATASLILTATPASAAAYIEAEATTNVYSRTAPDPTASTVYLFQGGQIAYVFCWVTGTSINGDTVWYRVRPRPEAGTPQGYVPGWYLTTGSDPNPNVGHC